VLQVTDQALRFRISPASFFQTNTLAAEVLYSLIKEWAQCSSETTVLDVCCGTGSIGLTLAKQAKKVVGVDIVEPGILDARLNSRDNGISNVEWFVGKAEDRLSTLVREHTWGRLIAVVDPPRGGLHIQCIRALRGSRGIKRIVYVSCNANSMKDNIIA
jgi:tRNA (uracil-5-)-methyltransferase